MSLFQPLLRESSFALSRSRTISGPCWGHVPTFLYALLNSTFETLRKSGVRWHQTFCPLDSLRPGIGRSPNQQQRFRRPTTVVQDRISTESEQSAEREASVGFQPSPGLTAHAQVIGKRPPSNFGKAVFGSNCSKQAECRFGATP